MKKAILTLFILGSVHMSLFAQDGIDELNQAASNLRSVYYAIIGFAYVICGVIGIIGSVRIYNKWNMGKEVIEDIAGWGFALLFAVVSIVFVSGLMGL